MQHQWIIIFLEIIVGGLFIPLYFLLFRLLIFLKADVVIYLLSGASVVVSHLGDDVSLATPFSFSSRDLIWV